VTVLQEVLNKVSLHHIVSLESLSPITRKTTARMSIPTALWNEV
jgi:hypothetical protein